MTVRYRAASIPVQGEPLLPQLEEAGVMGIEVCEDGTFDLLERCDDYFWMKMTREQLIQLADEIRTLAGKEGGASGVL